MGTEGSDLDSAVDPKRLADLHDRVRDLVDRTHRIGGWIALGTFAGYGLAGWLLWRDRPWLAAGVATVAFLVFRRFRGFALGLTRHWAGVQPDYAEAMAFIDEAVERLGERRALMEIDARLHRAPPPTGRRGR
jgi:hypothetical protein